MNNHSTSHEQSSCDMNRHYFKSILTEHGIIIGTTLYSKLFEFLMHPVNNKYLQCYFLLCSGYLEKNEITLRTEELLSELKFLLSGNYPYRYLFYLDEEWYEFYRENAYPSGDRRNLDDPRRGVCQKIADIVMKYKNGPPLLESLDDAFTLYFHKKFD